jgi:hypothetical protein
MFSPALSITLFIESPLLTDHRFVADMKLAHYLHIAPRTLFAAQGLATLVGAIVQCGVTVFMITRIGGVCTSDAEGNFTCPHGRVTYSSSLIWGKLSLLFLIRSSRSFCLGPRSPESRCHWPGASFLARSNVWELVMVLSRGSSGCDYHLSTWSPVESRKLPIMAGGFRRDEPSSSCYRRELLVVVGDQCPI